MTSADTRVNDLVVNVMTKEKFKKITPQDNQLYLTPDEDQEWEKPVDWIDIRSGALPKSIYFLVGHSADYSLYPTLSMYCTVSNNGTYDVFVDGIKQATTDSGSVTTLNWQTLALTSGWDVTYPSALRTHMVRITPSSSSNQMIRLSTGESNTVTGIMWVHFTQTTGVNLVYLLGHWNGSCRAPLCEAVTSESGELTVTSGNLNGTFSNSTALKSIPVLDLNNRHIQAAQCFNNTKLKEVYLRNIASVSDFGFFVNNSELKRINFDNVQVSSYNNAFNNNPKLENIPPLVPNVYYWGSNRGYMANALTGCVSLKSCVIDLSVEPLLKQFTVGGTSSAPITGLKGLTVSNQAPFDNATSPQLDVSYTGLSRAALVNLFNSMPYNVGYTVVGTPTIVDGVVSNFQKSSYVKTPSGLTATPIDKNIEICLKFTTTSDISGYQYFFSQLITGVVYGGINLFLNTGYLGSLASMDGSNWSSATTNYQLSADTTYELKYNYNKDTYLETFSIKQGNTWTEVATIQRASAIYGRTDDFAFGSGASFGNPFRGTLDLNSTYIKVNGIPYFTGKAAMTKTCSIVGCIGTADLTQDDKNIVLNKGWELTVA